MALGCSPLSVRSLGTLAALLTFVAPAAADPLAVLAAVKGKVQVVHASGATTTAGFGQALERGDKVIVPAGGAASVFFNDGNIIELAEKSSITVGGKVASKPRVGPGSELSADVYTRVSKFVTGGSAQTGLVAMATVRGSDTSAPVLLEPRNTGILVTKPSFAWRAVERATRYRVAVSGENGELWNREVTGSTLDYPSDAEPLVAGGDYAWEVQALSDLGLVRKESCSFEILKAEDAEAVRTDLDRIRQGAGGADNPANHFLAGSYLVGRQLYDDAARHFEVLARLAPEASAPHEALGKVYRDQGLMDLAAAEFQRALALAREP